MLSKEKQHQHDMQYLRIAGIISENSYAVKKKVGCLIVKGQVIISDGYNGTISGFPNKCEDDFGKTLPHVLHAEANALTKLARTGRKSKGATLYCTWQPCLSCAKLIIQCGIKRIVYSEKHDKPMGLNILKRAKVEINFIKL